MRRAKGSKKNLLLTLWLFLPFAVLATIIGIIFNSYGNKKMDARPVGQGAGETGGANALGELLAGNDPGERERTARDLREGRLIDPLEWPDGVRFVIDSDPGALSGRTLILWSGDEGGVFMSTCSPDARCEWILPRETIREAFAAGRPGAGFYFAPSEAISFAGGRVFADGQPLQKIAIPPVAADTVSEGVPIEIIVPFESDD
jgi:hypothetical protein